jgi:lipopolysaccharide exporter
MGWKLAKRSLQRGYHWLRHPGGSLSERVVHGSIWVFVLRIVNNSLGFARTVVVARLLAPNDFGLFGVAMLALSSLEAFSETGFSQALIQKEEDPESYLDSAWTVQVIRGLMMSALMAVGAPLVGAFFGEPRAVPMVRVLGAAELLKSLQNIGIVYFRKELEFHRLFVYQVSGTAANLAVAVPAALILRNAWALILGLLVSNAVQATVSYVVHDYRPRPRLDLSKSKALFDFGRWRLASSILVFLLIQGDDFFLGKLLGATALGLYQMAYRISNLPATEITHVISQVTFPAYSRLQGNLALVRQGFIRVMQLTAFLSFPLAAGIASLASPFTSLFLGAGWSRMVPALQALTLWGVIRSLDAATSAVWLGIGKPHLPTVFQFAKVLLLAAAIYPLTSRWGILGTALAVVFESVVVHLWRFSVMAKTLQCKTGDLLQHLLGPGLAAIAMSATIFGLSHLMPHVNMLAFFALIATGVLVYLSTVCLLGPSVGWNYRSVIEQLSTRFRSARTYEQQ